MFKELHFKGNTIENNLILELVQGGDILMDIFKVFIDEIRKIVREEIHNAIDEIVKKYVEDKWMDKKQLAEYWGVSVKWIENNLDDIPHSKTLPWRFKKSLADQWRMGELKKLEVVN